MGQVSKKNKTQGKAQAYHSVSHASFEKGFV